MSYRPNCGYRSLSEELRRSDRHRPSAIKTIKAKVKVKNKSAEKSIKNAVEALEQVLPYTILGLLFLACFLNIRKPELVRGLPQQVVASNLLEWKLQALIGIRLSANQIGEFVP